MAPAPDAPFFTLVTPTPLAPHRYGFDFPEGWLQGRGLFGGLVVAAMIRGLEASVADAERSLRSLTAELCGPTLPGPAEVVVEVLRVGKAVSTLTARMMQGGEVQAHAVGVFGKTRADPRRLTELPRPAMPDWRTCDVLPVQPPLGPEFARSFDFRLVSGMPFSGADKPVTSVWTKPKNPGPARDAAWVAACADACWPTLFVVDDAPRPMSTIGFTLQLTGSTEGLEPEAPLLHVGRGASVADGYLVEFRELWGHDGRLVALNQQTFAIIR